MIGVVILAIAAVAVVAIELDAQARRTRRFGIALRRSHLHGSVRRPWRWSVQPLYTPDSVPFLARAEHPTHASGRTRTYLGARLAAHRARVDLEVELARDRAEFVASLLGTTDPRTLEVFPAEIVEERR